MSTTIKKVMPFNIIVMLFYVVGNTTLAQENLLDNYIQRALENNQGIRQQQFQLEKGLFALKEAQALYLPSVSVQGSYVKAQGGRTIDFPIGDLLNPVYTTLNQLTESSNFPQLENASIQLNPDNFYDLRLRTTLPLIDAEMWLNRKIKSEQITQYQASVNVYKRQLVKDIKTAYFQYFQAVKAIEIYENALRLVNENIRMNASMFKNGVRNSTALTRAKSEKQKIEADLNHAENQVLNAQAYFNFLLNQPLEHPVSIDSVALSEPVVDPIHENEYHQREELIQLQSTSQVYALNRDLQRAHFIPKINTFLDLGSQGFNWNVDSQSKYYLWGINLQWDLFAANRYRYKTRQADADLKAIEAQTAQTEQALNLQLVQARNNYQSAYSSYTNAQTQLTLAQKYYQDQLKVYKGGQLLYIELLDAQNELTGAQLQLSISLAAVQIAQADIERCTASYPIQ